MTTKNSEILFDLQKFSTDTLISAATTTINTTAAYNSFDTVGGVMATIGASNSSINVYGGWIVADNMTNGQTYATLYGASETKPASVTDTINYGDTVYDHNATFTYYSFSGSNNNSLTIANGTSTDSAEAAASSTYVSLASASLPSGIAFDNTIKASPITVAGGGFPAGGVSLKGVGSIADFAEGQNIALKAGSGNVSLSGVNGTVALSALGNTLKQNFNGASIHATGLSNPVTIDAGNSWAAPTISTSYADLVSVDAVQTWSVSGGIGYANVYASAVSDPIIAKGSSSVSSSNYLNITVNSGNAVQLSGGSGSGAHDTIGVNGTVIAGAAKAGANIAAGDESSVLTAAITNAASINVGGGTGTIGGAASVAAGANVTIAASGTNGRAVITAIDQLAANGAWSLGANATLGQLGADTVNFASASGVITANADGTKVAALANGGNVTLSGVGSHSLNANGGVWTLGAISETASSVVSTFDSSGNATVASGATLIAGNSKSLAIGANGANDTMSLGGASQVTLNEGGVVLGVNSLAAGSSWLVRGGEAREVSIGTSNVMDIKFSNQASSGLFGEITTSTVSGAQVAGIDSLSGNVTVTSASSSISGLNVAGTTWSISNPNGNTVDFNSTGKLAALTASNSTTDLTVTAAATDASVVVSLTGGDTLGGTFNGAKVYVHDGDSIVGVQLESDASVMGITGITSLNSGATVIGDNEYKVNENFAIRKGNNTTTQFTLGSASQMTIQNVVDGDAYTVVGASGSTVVYDIDSTVTSGGQAKVSVNSAAVTVTASTDSSVNSVYISATYGDDVAKVEGVKLNDTISSSGDSNFSVVYDTSNATSSTDTYVMTVNDAKVSLKSSNIVNAGSSSITVAVDNSSTMPHINISSGIANSSTVTVGRGVYSVGSSAAVTVNDAIGFLYVDSNGNVTAEDSMVADIRRERDGEIDSLVSSLSGSAPSSGPFHDFYNLYYGNNDVFGNNNEWPYTVASYADATVTTHSASISSTGVNIYAEKPLSDYPNSVTLQSFLSTPINVEHIEGRVSGTATLANAVIDVSNSTNQVVAVGMNTDSSIDSFAVNHTILGSARTSTLMVGEKATGDNLVRGGNGGNRIVHRGNGKATLVGGSGSDTIYAVSGDSVVGGSGADYYYDNSAFEISDYNINDGDVVIATKLSSSSNLSRANVSVDGNRLAVAGGSTLTIGASDQYDENTATKAIVTNANNSSSNRTLLVWAGVYDSEVNASVEGYNKGAFMISDNNEGGADSVIGSAYADTIYVGGNDTVYGGKGNDIINITAVSSDSGRRGAMVVLSEDTNNVNGWTGGFDNEGGSNIIALANTASTASHLNFKTKSGVVVAYSDGASLNFNDISPSSGGGYDFLVNQEKVTFITSNQTVSVLSDDALANYYKGEKAAGIYVGDSVTSELLINLGSSNYTNVTKVDLHNESHASVLGTAANESITLVGSADAGAGKSVAAGAGNDYIVSGGNSTTNAGNCLIFGTEGNITYSTGRDTIENFGFYRGKSTDMDLASTDLLYISGVGVDDIGINTTANKLEISLNDSDKIVISDSSGFSTSDNKAVRMRFVGDETTYLAKFGLSSGFNQFTYDGETNAFFGNTGRGRDTLNVASDLNNVSIWLSDGYFDQNIYEGINVINASNVTDAKTSLVGSYTDSNLIQAAGSGTNNSLWGGGGESNTLIGGAGDDTFFYFKSTGYTDGEGNHHSGNDVIQNVQSNDLVWMADVMLSDLTSATLDSGTLTFGLTDGSSVKVANMGTEVTFRAYDGKDQAGQDHWTDYKASIAGSQLSWSLA